jgi:hypothetical protein
MQILGAHNALFSASFCYNYTWLRVSPEAPFQVSNLATVHIWNEDTHTQISNSLKKIIDICFTSFYSSVEHKLSFGNRHSSVGTALGYGLDYRWFECWQRLGIFLFTTVSRPALGPYPLGNGGSFPGDKAPECEADHSSPSCVEVKECVELYLHSPIRLHGVVLS